MSRRESRWTSLHSAAQKGSKTKVRLLLQLGSDAAAKDSSGRTALQMAAMGGHDAVVKVLLEKGADVSATNNKGFTAMAFAVQQGHREVVRELLKYADPNENVAQAMAALQVAAIYGQEAVACLLLENGASLDVKD
jgi:ankyrin repeat protein